MTTPNKHKSVSEQLIDLQLQLADAAHINKDQSMYIKEVQYEKKRLLEAFNELLDLHLELRHKVGLGDMNEETKYHFIDKAGLTDYP